MLKLLILINRYINVINSNGAIVKVFEKKNTYFLINTTSFFNVLKLKKDKNNIVQKQDMFIEYSSDEKEEKEEKFIVLFKSLLIKTNNGQNNKLYLLNKPSTLMFPKHIVVVQNTYINNIVIQYRYCLLNSIFLEV